MWDLHPHNCARWSNKIHISNFIKYFVPIFGDRPFRSIMDLDSSWHLIGGVLGITNTFQNKFLPPNIDSTSQCYPSTCIGLDITTPLKQIKESKKGSHLLQACNLIHIIKPAKRNWWISPGIVLNDCGLHNFPCRNVLYVFAKQDEYMIVMVSTDDLFSFFCNPHALNYLNITQTRCFHEHLSRVPYSSYLTFIPSSQNMA